MIDDPWEDQHVGILSVRSRLGAWAGSLAERLCTVYVKRRRSDEQEQMSSYDASLCAHFVGLR